VSGPVTGADLGIPALPNLRDLGGHPTRDGGRVRSGLLYRSSDLARLGEADTLALAQLDIRAVFDLRSDGERELQPDRLPPGAAYVPLDVLRGSTEVSPSELMRAFMDPVAAREVMGGERGYALWERQYREFVRLDGARAGYGRLFADLADAANRPALFHCTTGKDRTGWAAGALLLLLGVPEEVVMDDYLLSARYLEPVLRPALEALRARGVDPELLAPIVAVRREYLEAALDEMRRRHGSIERYFDEGLGIGPATQQELRTALVEPAARSQPATPSAGLAEPRA
jgi:protein-tyrosine phosphatase